MSSPRESRDVEGVGNCEPTLVRAVKTPGPKWDRKHREEGQGREGGILEAGSANLGVPLGSTDTVLGHTACTIAPSLGLSFPICKKSELIRCLQVLGTVKPPPQPCPSESSQKMQNFQILQNQFRVLGTEKTESWGSWLWKKVTP